MSRAIARFAATLVLCAALAPARAAGDWERFFVPFLGDLRAEASDAGKTGLKGLVLMFHFDDCPACARMKREVLSRPEVQRYFRGRFAAVAIDTRGAVEVTGFDGRTLPENVFARALGIRATPTFMFYAPDGSLLTTHLGAIYDPAEFILLGEYVASGAYRGASFAAFRQSKHKRGS